MTDSAQTPGIEIAPLTKSEGQWMIDPSGLDAARDLILACLTGTVGAPDAVKTGWSIFNAIKREVPKEKLAQDQGFTLYVSAMGLALGRLFNEAAPEVLGSDATKAEIPGVIIGAMRREPLNLTRRFLDFPALNPGFTRVREAVEAVLHRLPEGMLSPDAIERIGGVLGRRFVQAIDDVLSDSNAEQNFALFLEAIAPTALAGAARHARLWDAYEAHLSEKVYGKLFLHELDGHPEAGLADLYVPSRAMHREEPEDDDLTPGQSPIAVHGFDLATHLHDEWLGKTVQEAGPARLISGEPGTGKSTFALMFAHDLFRRGYRALLVPANSIRSLTLDLETILNTHLSRILGPDDSPNILQDLKDPQATGKPLVIILDGLDEYDTGGPTVAAAAAQLAQHAQTVVREWADSGHAVRLILCGRPEATAGLASDFRKPFHHVLITGFTVDLVNQKEMPADEASKTVLDHDQRADWWRLWLAQTGAPDTALPEAIFGRKDGDVREITAQPLLNYMMATLGLHEDQSYGSLASIYEALFARYYERQCQNKSTNFDKVCPNLDRFRRIMGEIGIAAWHAGDRSVSLEDLRARFSEPPLKGWFEKAGPQERGLSAVLSAFYTRPESAMAADQKLADRYLFTHKSFREYLTGIAIVRFLSVLAAKLDPDAEDGWSEEHALKEWLALFGPRAMDARQHEFVWSALQEDSVNYDDLLAYKKAAETLFNQMIRRRMPVPEGVSNLSEALTRAANAEEAMIGILDALRWEICERHHRVSGVGGPTPLFTPDMIELDIEERPWAIQVSWPQDANDASAESDHPDTAFKELLHRLRSRPGAPETFWLAHIGALLERRAPAQLATQVRHSGRYPVAVAINLSGADLSYVDFQETDLMSADLRSTVLIGARLNNANLSDANLEFSVLHDAELIGIEGTRVKLRHAGAQGANFTNSLLEDANLQNAGLWESNFDNAVLEAADLSNAALTDADLSNADLSDADLGGADLSNADLTNADLTDATLEGANLTGAIMSGVIKN